MKKKENYLRPSVRHCGYYDAYGQHGHAEDLHLRVPLSPDESNKHCGHTAAASEDYMYGDRNVITEGKVVENVYREEEDHVRKPASERNGSRF